MKAFENAIRYFRKQNYQKAAPFFEKVATSPVREMADRARIHLRLCEQRNRHESAPKNAEEYYLRGVAALNDRDADLAVQYLKKSAAMRPNQDHVHYALAAAYVLQSNGKPALSHLQKAIELRPENRVRARFDDDFQGLAPDPRFSQLLRLDRDQ